MADPSSVSTDMNDINDTMLDEIISSSTSDMSGIDKLPLGNNSEDVEARALFTDNSQQNMQYSNSEYMFIDDVSSPDGGEKNNLGSTDCNSPFVRISPSIRNLNNEIDLVKNEFNHSSGEDEKLKLSPRNVQHFCDSPLSAMLIESPPRSDLIHDNDAQSDLFVNGINSECTQSEKNVITFSGNAISPQKNLGNDAYMTSPILYTNKVTRMSSASSALKDKMLKNKGVVKMLQPCKTTDVIREIPKEFYFKKHVPSTPTRSVRKPGIANFLGSPSRLRNARLLGSPVGRKLDFDCAPKSSTPKRSFEKMNNSAPGPVESQSTPMDLFLPRRCNSEGGKRIDKSFLHLWVNPFSPAGRNIISDIRNVQEKTRRKRSSELSPEEKECETFVSPKKVKRSTNSRYESEFAELEEIGTGEHGCVYKCLNLINGLIYAIKISKNKVKRGFSMETAQNELYAHGVLEHKNIVRNYSSWVEDGYVYIQNEFCNRGNLESYMKAQPVVGNKAKKLLYDIASALRYMHTLRLIHLDVKPGNIFVHESLAEIDNVSDSESEEESDVAHVVFKLGDFGHIIHLNNLRNLEEGDCRYMARELLNEDTTDITKADIFSLALSVYEAAGGGGGVELPKNGCEWHVLRDGGLRKLPGLSDEMNLLLKKMTDPDLTKRPSAAEICKMLAPVRKTEKLKEELQSKTQKIAVLEAKQRERNNFIKQLKAQSLKFIQASDDIHTPRSTEKQIGKQKKRYSRIHFI